MSLTNHDVLANSQPAVYAYCLKLTKNHAIAKDLQQAANEKVLDICAKNEKVITVGYLITTAASLFIDGKRKQKNINRRLKGIIADVRYVEPEFEPGSATRGSCVDMVDLVNASERLSANEKRVIILRCQRKGSVKDLAIFLGMNKNSFNTNYMRGLAKLRIELAQNGITLEQLTEALIG